jgi:hypothetical protein
VSLRGSLSELQLVDLVEMMSLGNKTGLLTLYDERDVSAGEMAFADGLLVDAKCGPLVGAKAFYALLALSEGSFSVDSDFEPPVAMSGLATPSLLMEGMRRLDETGRMRQRLPGGARVVAVHQEEPADPVESAVLAHLGSASAEIDALLDQMLDSGAVGEYDVFSALERLLERGTLETDLQGTSQAELER